MCPPPADPLKPTAVLDVVSPKWLQLSIHAIRIRTTEDTSTTSGDISSWTPSPLWGTSLQADPVHVVLDRVLGGAAGSADVAYVVVCCVMCTSCRFLVGAESRTQSGQAMASTPKVFGKMCQAA
ncbi:hypothetical protein DPEC_G00245830 [Dallia pectoralis]|uniref:Uncharacterized protein n=1 Tax=Dallia pectoralis TaxID=75939 RepID=A0ACC2FW41_DALPE|nr:hypothetical protein DPEC_G00245830 [Dallia pectoralis]